jgi:hypothetical protein
VGGDREPCFGVGVLFGEVDVSLGCGVDSVDVDALAGAGSDVGGDDDERVWGGCVPYAGILAGGRANLMAVEKGRRRRRKKRAVGNMGRHEEGMEW